MEQPPENDSKVPNSTLNQNTTYTHTKEIIYHPGWKNLIPMNQRTVEEQRKIQSMGGKVKSHAKSVSAKIRCMKMSKEITPEQAQKLNDVMKDPELSSLDIRMIIEKAIAKLGPDAKDYQIVNCSRLLMEWHKMTHGEKIKTENVNLNIQVPIDEWNKRLLKLNNGND